MTEVHGGTWTHIREVEVRPTMFDDVSIENEYRRIDHLQSTFNHPIM